MGKEAEALLERVKAWKPDKYKTKEEYENVRKEKMKYLKNHKMTDEEVQSFFESHKRNTEAGEKKIAAIKASGQNVVESVTFPDEKSMNAYFKR